MSKKAIGNNRAIGGWQLAIGSRPVGVQISRRDEWLWPIANRQLPIAFFTVTVPGTSVMNRGLAHSVLIGVGKQSGRRWAGEQAHPDSWAMLPHCSFGESSCIQ